MPEISATVVKQLRDATNVSMMECKKALIEADGDMDKALRILRERGIAVAAKKATRAANQGLVASSSKGGKISSLVEVNCETDFVARNPDFRKFVEELADKACDTDDSLAETLKDVLTAKIAEIGENIIMRRNIRFILGGNGAIGSYIHLGGKVGVLVELACSKPETAETPVFAETLKDLTLHIAAVNPRYLVPEDVPADVTTSEREIYAKQVKDKPAEIVQKIVDGKIKKFYEEVCLVHQGFVKEPKQSIAELLKEKGTALNDTLVIKRFTRYQMGE